MAENFDLRTKDLCKLADKLSISDLCGNDSPQTANPPAHTHRSPFSDAPSSTQPKETQRSEPGSSSSTPDWRWPMPQLQPPRPQESAAPRTPENSNNPHQSAPRPEPKELPNFTKSGADRNGHLPTVYIDIGHCTSSDKGKFDFGFEVDKYNECQVNKAVGLNLIKELRSDGYRVVPTWDPAAPPPIVSKQEDLQRRNNVVNSDIARTGGDSIYVSIHHDNDGDRIGGQCVFFAEPKQSEAMTLARSIQSSAWKVKDASNYCIKPDTETQNGKLVGLRGVNTVGVLIEGANSQNKTDYGKMMKPEFHRYEAHKIAEGIKNYFRLKPGVERPYLSR
jgi:N-acetylmuramoyl-L-alanine amidase